MTFLCDSKYLLFPASHHAQNKRLYFRIGGKLVYDLVCPLDYDQPDYTFYLNVERFSGQEIELTSEPDMELAILKSNEGVPEKEAYAGKYRPLAHYTVKRGWLNDPNGLFYYKGKYFMFYQHNPVACTWENMHWGLAVSDDLTHWKEQGVAFYPDEMGTMFSGSAILDEKNVSGLKEGEDDPILLFYTAAGSTSETSKGEPFTQCLAYSTDGGKTFRKYAGNPLIKQIAGGNRDPKVIYYEPTDSYIMALFLEDHEFALYSSKNLVDWSLFQKITLPEDAECPDIYPLSVDGDENNVKWVLIGASDKYYIGSFDGTKFTPETGMKSLNFGNNSYAAQSWSNAPENRRIRTSFATVVIPGMPFGSCMSIPQEMSLKTVNGELRLCAQPVREIQRLYAKTEEYEAIAVTTGKPFTVKTDGKAYDISLSIKMGTGSTFRFSLFGLNISYEEKTGELKCLDKTAVVPLNGNELSLRLVIDTVYAELFTGEGSRFMGMTYIQDSNLNTLAVEAKQGDLRIGKLTLSKLNRFWE